MNESQVDQLLRKRCPEVPVPPGLETRIRASLRSTSRQRRFRIVWLAAPLAALAALLLVLAPDRQRPATVVDSGAEDPVPPSIVLATDNELSVNPLGDEARALRNDAERTGRFLLDCLPSMSLAEK